MNADHRPETHNKRLLELASLWDEQSKLGMLDKFSPADLRLMLESFTPLQDIIRQIANDPATPLSMASPEQVASELAVSEPASEPETNTAASDLQWQQQLAEARAEIARLQIQAGEDADKLKAATDSIKQQSEQITALKQGAAQLEQQFEQQLADAQQAADYRQQQLEQTHAELASEQSTARQLASELKLAQQQAASLQQKVDLLSDELSQSQSPIELQTLREDSELARSLGLELPANDQQALITMVSVLAQKDNLERLWDNLKERCEAEKRPANHQELSLLNSALGWYNHNWKLRPFQLLQPAEGISFDFEQQQKAKHNTDGETLSQIWLAGLADGAGKPLRKTLVLTR